METTLSRTDLLREIGNMNGTLNHLMGELFKRERPPNPRWKRQRWSVMPRLIAAPIQGACGEPGPPRMRAVSAPRRRGGSA